VQVEYQVQPAFWQLAALARPLHQLWPLQYAAPMQVDRASQLCGSLAQVEQGSGQSP
jgi:hypothetical protein